MDPTIEAAASGRARCRGCGHRIERGALRLGEHCPSPYSDTRPMTLWFHLRCGAYKRPSVASAALEVTDAVEPELRAQLRRDVEPGLVHRRLPRLDGAERSPSGRARCRQCREPIERQSWRVAVVYYEEGRFEPAGYLHVGCAAAYGGTTELEARVLHFTGELEPSEAADLRAALASGGRTEA